MKARARLLSLLLLLAAPLRAQLATLVEDINRQGSGGSAVSSDPDQLATLGDKVVFAADAASGRELWATDGTATGTELLADICRRDCSSRPELLGVVGGVSFWSAEDDDSDVRGLWRSDGTRAGTYALTSALDDPRTGRRFTAVSGGRLFFPGCSSGRGCELWASDGTPGGTHPLFGDPAVGGARPEQLTVAGGTLFYVADEGFEQGLWVSDGTPGGTSLLHLFDRPAGPGLLTAAGGRLFFIARLDGANIGQELWVSDGTAAGTRALSQFVPDDALDVTTWLKPIGSAVYFLADDVTHGTEIWASDGTVAGTRRVTEFGFHAPFDGATGPESLEEVGGRLVFVASDGLSASRLWTTTGHPDSTAALACGAAPCPELTDRPRLLKLGQRLFFPAADDGHGAELWGTDGTAAGTRMVSDICPGSCSGWSLGPFAFGNAMLLVASADGDFFTRQVWRSDGTARGTRQHSDLPTGGAGARLDQFSLEAVALGAQVLFPAEDARGVELWASDGRDGGTRLLGDLAAGPPSALPRDLVAAGGALYFRACEGGSTRVWRSGGSAATTSPVSPTLNVFCLSIPGDPAIVATDVLTFYWDHSAGTSAVELWRTDGTPAGTIQLTHFGFDADRQHTTLVVLGDAVYFNIGYHEHSRPDEIWTSDGTVDGTGVAFDLGDASTPITFLAAAGGALYVVGEHPDEGQQLWRSDGTGVTKLRSGLRSLLPSFAAVGPLVYFVAQEDTRNHLWATNGTPAGTRTVAPVFFVFDDPFQLVPFHGALYFFAERADGYGLWTTDGTEQGTLLVHGFADKDPVFGPIHPHVVVAGERLFFRASDGASGQELWASDGTAAGTYVVRDVVPGPGSSYPTPLAAAGGRLFFVAHDAVHGFELWTSDGTAGGTRLVHDLAPGAASSSPDELTLADNRFYFSADDGLVGRELWTIDLAQPPGACLPAETALCLGGRFRVEAAWKDFSGNSGIGRTVPLTADTGAFWFFGPENIEVILKVLDGRGLNQHHWVFYGALSSVEYALTVTDVQTGLDDALLEPLGPARERRGHDRLRPARRLLGRRALDLRPAAAHRRGSGRCRALPAGGHPPLPPRRPLRGRGDLEGLFGQHRRRQRRPAHRRHRLLLVLRRGQRGGRAQGARRHPRQRQALGLLRRALQRRIHPARHRHGDRRGQDLHQQERQPGERRRHRSVLGSVCRQSSPRSESARGERRMPPREEKCTMRR